MRYLLFAGDKYYPVGGLHDLIAMGDSVEGLKKALAEVKDHIKHKDQRITWWHIVDKETMERIAWSTDQGQAGIFEGGEE